MKKEYCLIQMKPDYMQNYLDQLHLDIQQAMQTNTPSGNEAAESIVDWVTDEEEDRTAPVHNLQDLTGIRAGMLPPENMLTDEQVSALLLALNQLLDEYNWVFVLQRAVPDRMQYETIRQNFDQDVKIKKWHMGFFQLCKKGTIHKSCALGEYCECAFYEELFSRFSDEELSPEEERARMLQIEISHIKRKYDDDWLKYYPYHLDPAYDNENGNPYNYGFDEQDADEDEDCW